MTCEFKEPPPHQPIKAIGDAVDRYVVAYLNEGNGSVYWGIRDSDQIVVGVRLNPKMRDELRQVVGLKISEIAPAVSADCYDVPFHPVVTAEDGTLPVKDTFVVELSVRAPPSGGLYLTGNGEAYRKTLGGIRKLTGAELHMALLKQLHPKVEQSAAWEGTENPDLSWMPSVARRAKVVRPLLRGARALWVDDNPSNNLYERTMLASLGISVDPAFSTDEALYIATRLKYDLILSDMNRASNPRAGLELLEQLKLLKIATPVVYYVGQLERDRQSPLGAFGITSVSVTK